MAEAGVIYPLFVKIAPDLEDGDIDTICATALDEGIDGLIATNTTIARPGTLRSPHAARSGGLSGAPLFERATHVLAAIAGRLPADGPALVGVGGVASGWQAYAKIWSAPALCSSIAGWRWRDPSCPGGWSASWRGCWADGILHRGGGRASPTPAELFNTRFVLRKAPERQLQERHGRPAAAGAQAPRGPTAVVRIDKGRAVDSREA